MSGKRIDFFVLFVNVPENECIVIREDKNGNMFCDGDATSLKKLKGIAEQELRKPNAVNAQQFPYVEQSLAYYIAKSQNASKIVGKWCVYAPHGERDDSSL